MDSKTYQRFIDRLVVAAESDPGIVGLVAMGSMAERSHSPDEWSDHDLWVIGHADAVGRLRSEYDWLPDPDRVVGHFIETKHGRSVVYEDGHLIEMAVFAEDELAITSANDFRVLYDMTGTLESRLAAIVAATSEKSVDPNRAEHAAGRFIVTLIIGLGRYARGELLSASELIREHAVAALLQVVPTVHPPSDPSVLDNLDPHRRFEKAYPELAHRIGEAQRNAAVVTAQVLVDIARELGIDERPPLSGASLDAVQALIDRAASARPAAESTRGSPG